MLVLGGKNQSGKRLDSVELYDPVKDKWTIAENLKMPKNKSGFACVTSTSVNNFSIMEDTSELQDFSK